MQRTALPTCFSNPTHLCVWYILHKYFLPPTHLLRVTACGHTKMTHGIVSTSCHDWIAVAHGKSVLLCKPELDLDVDVQESVHSLHEKHSDTVQSIVFSPNSTMLASAGDDKLVLIHQLSEAGDSWDLKFSLSCDKKVSSLCFSSDSKILFSADRFGCIYVTSLGDIKDSSTVELSQISSLSFGHYGPITDMVCLGNDVVTADQDCKIRVTPINDISNIKSFCLGHSKFITSICGVSAENRLVSASADGDICLWDTSSGHKLSQVSLVEDYSSKLILNMKFLPNSNIIVVAVANAKELLVYQVQNDQLSSFGFIILPECPIYLSSDSSDRLWVLTEGDEKVFCTPISIEDGDILTDFNGKSMEPALSSIREWIVEHFDSTAVSLVEYLQDIEDKGEAAYKKSRKH